MRTDNLASTAAMLTVCAILYQGIAWQVFQWRNPTANEMSFYRNFIDVATWRKLPEYQAIETNEN